jgi:hypothetical protein
VPELRERATTAARKVVELRFHHRAGGVAVGEMAQLVDELLAGAVGPGEEFRFGQLIPGALSVAS